MKIIKVVGGVLISLLAAHHAFAQEEMPISSARLSDRILLVKYGTNYNDLVAAINTEKGIVIIDTGMAPSLTRHYRSIIEKEFPGKEFAYVINTHYHYDHTMGNQVFSEATVIGHERCREGMTRIGNDIQAFIDSQAARIPAWETQLASLDPQSDQAQQARETIDIYRIMCRDLEQEFVLTPPDITFSDQMNLDLGDITLKLVYFGEGRHTGDDILVLCPEEKALFTGDLFFSGAIQLSYGSVFDPDRWIEALDNILSGDYEIEHVVTTHNGFMTLEQMEVWHRYLAELWQGINDAREKSWDFEDVDNKLAIEMKFTYLRKYGLSAERLRQNHQQNLLSMWRLVNNTKSAMEELQNLLFSTGLSAAEQRYAVIEAAPEDEYYFSEEEFNRLGYRLLNNSMFNEAVYIFRLNVKHFPDSWNVYDSLGEVYMRMGKMDLAISNYEKSLEINPGNDNGRAMLARIREGMQD